MNILQGDITKTLIITFVLGVIIALILGPITIPLLKRLKFGQNIREEGPKSHLKKAGTPTMGGVMFILSTTIVMLIVSRSLTDKGMVALYSLIAFGFIGFLDDILKILKKQSEGLKAWQKMVLLLIVSGAFAYYSYVNLPHDIAIPFTSMTLPLGVLYIPFVIFVYASMTNAVNLTDGLDGLAGGLSAIAFLAFGLIAMGSWWIEGNSDMGIFCFILMGSIMGFLVYNSNPAKVFMGDTGSLTLGATMATIAILTSHELSLAVIGGVFVIETLTVIIQISSVVLLKRRVFLMTPIHHHFERLGWRENDIVKLFWIVGFILSLCALIYGVWL